MFLFFSMYLEKNSRKKGYVPNVGGVLTEETFLKICIK